MSRQMIIVILLFKVRWGSCLEHMREWNKKQHDLDAAGNHGQLLWLTFESLKKVHNIHVAYGVISILNRVDLFFHRTWGEQCAWYAITWDSIFRKKDSQTPWTDVPSLQWKLTPTEITARTQFSRVISYEKVIFEYEKCIEGRVPIIFNFSSGKVGDWKSKFTVEQNINFNKLMARELGNHFSHLRLQEDEIWWNLWWWQADLNLLTLISLISFVYIYRIYSICIWLSAYWIGLAPNATCSAIRIPTRPITKTCFNNVLNANTLRIEINLQL